jgi:hypothetical protein
MEGRSVTAERHTDEEKCRMFLLEDLWRADDVCTGYAHPLLAAEYASILRPYSQTEMGRELTGNAVYPEGEDAEIVLMVTNAYERYRAIEAAEKRREREERAA